MGMKKSPAMPPPVDTSVVERTEKKEAALEAEKAKMLGAKKQGMYGTVLTSGMGDTSDAEVGKTMLGGVK